MTIVTETQEPSITFLNASGDITITWDEDKADGMLDVIQKKMDAGFSFFILKPRALGMLGAKKTLANNIEQIRRAGEVTAPDALAKSILLDLGDEDVSKAVSKHGARITRIDKSASMDTVQRASSAAQVSKSHTVAIRPLQGG